MTDRLHRLLEWPLWSWKHLAITVAGVLVMVALVGKASSALSPEAAPGPTTADARSSMNTPSGLHTSAYPLVPRMSPSSRPAVIASEPRPIGPCEEVVARFGAESGLHHPAHCRMAQRIEGQGDPRLLHAAREGRPRPSPGQPSARHPARGIDRSIVTDVPGCHRRWTGRHRHREGWRQLPGEWPGAGGERRGRAHARIDAGVAFGARRVTW